MARAMRCDRCGKYYELTIQGGDLYGDFVRVGLMADKTNSMYKDKTYDLCPRCRKSLNEWINKEQ